MESNSVWKRILWRMTVKVKTAPLIVKLFLLGLLLLTVWTMWQSKSEYRVPHAIEAK